MKLSERQIQKAIREAKNRTLNDGAGGKGTGSLRLVIRDGAALWFAMWQQNGQRRKKQLGRYPDLSLEAARDKYDEQVRAVLQEGKNPRSFVAQAEKPTVERLFHSYVAAMRAAGKSSADDVERSLLTGKYAAVKHLGKEREAGAIDPADISDYLAAMYRRGAKIGADRTRAHLSAAFNWGIKSTHDYTVENRRDWAIRFNPVSAVKRDTATTKPRDRELSRAEIKALWNALESGGFEPQTRTAIKLLLLCGQRVRETLRLEPGELVEGIWLMPAEKTKGKKRPHAIPLPSIADLVLYGFDGFTIKDTSINRALTRWCDENEIPRFQTRDLRRTWKTRTAEAGIDRFTRDLIQQHAKNDTGSKHYDRFEYINEKRAAMDKWGEWLNSVLQ